MKLEVGKLIDRLKRYNTIYIGDLYKINGDKITQLTKDDRTKNSKEVIKNIFYRRSILSDNYVIETKSGKKIELFIDNKKDNNLVDYYIPVKDIGKNFSEKKATDDDFRNSIYNKNDINKIADENKVYSGAFRETRRRIKKVVNFTKKTWHNTKVFCDKANFYKRAKNVYVGDFYTTKNGNPLYLNENNTKENSKLLLENVYYKRALFSDDYVIEVKSGRKINILNANKLEDRALTHFIYVPDNGKNNKIFKGEKVSKVVVDENGKKIKRKKLIKNANYDKSYFKTLLEPNGIKGKFKSIKDFFSNRNRIKSSNLDLAQRRAQSGNQTEEVKEAKQEEVKVIDVPHGNVEETKKEEVKPNEPKEKDVEETKVIDAPYKAVKEAKQEEVKVIDVPYRDVEETKKEEEKINESKKTVIDEKIENVVKDSIKTREEKIEELKQIKEEQLCNYWANKEYPKKEKIVLDQQEKSYYDLIKQVVSTMKDNNIVEVNIDGIKLSTQILKTEEELLGYFIYKKTGNKDFITENSKENCYQMIRADRKIR